MNQKKPVIMMCAGGTGGHIFPALAIAKKLEKNYTIIWLGSEKGMEHSLVKNYPIFSVKAVGLRGKSIKQLVTAPFKILSAIFQTARIIKKNKVKLSITMGGFVGGIGGIGSILTKTKFIIHEQNSIAGTSNKWLNKWSSKSFQAFDGALEYAQTCGNPINFSLKNKLAKTDTNLNILILGGSLGAKALNNIAPQITRNFNIWHQTGKGNSAKIITKYKQVNDNLKVEDFINNMEYAYSWADIVIARSGAMTISELIYTKTPAILIPYPFAIDNHQLHNAEILTKRGCGFLIPEKDLSVEKITTILREITKSRLAEMCDNFNKFESLNPIDEIKNHIDLLMNKT